jgi:hypothetical protein
MHTLMAYGALPVEQLPGLLLPRLLHLWMLLLYLLDPWLLLLTGLLTPWLLLL